MRVCQETVYTYIGCKNYSNTQRTSAFTVLFLLFALFLVLGLFRFFVLVTAVLVFLLILGFFVLFSALAILLGLFVFGEDKVAEFVTHVDHFFGAARHALVIDGVVLDLVLGLGQTAVGAKDKLVNVSLDQVLERGIRMSSIDNGPVGVGIVARLRPELGPKELVDLGGLAVQRGADIGNVGNDCFDTISTAFNLSKNSRHFVTVLWVVNGRRASKVNDGSSTHWHGGR